MLYRRIILWLFVGLLPLPSYCGDTPPGLSTAAAVSRGVKLTPVEAVKPYDDVRNRDLRALDLSQDTNLPATLTFNQNTAWPGLPAGVSPEGIIEAGKNPGLGVRALHKAGITGKGVAVAIIDQPTYKDHPEFAGKIVKYFDTGCESEWSMHGPGVLSLLVGKEIGTAPDAEVYYVANPSWKSDAAYYARALDWIVKQNKSLPKARKIRVVSVSAAPSGPNSPVKKNNKLWDAAYARAVKSGLLVMDCEDTNGFIGPCTYDPADPENPAKCKKGLPNLPGYDGPYQLMAPASGRTVAEDTEFRRFSYAYWAQGGRSWSVPYVAGVAAMGWQVNPELSSAQLKDMLMRSATAGDGGVINPPAFIELVRASVRPPAGKK